VRYHFGDVDGLLRDLALRNAARIADVRTGMLDALERERKAAFPPSSMRWSCPCSPLPR
jgi:hypothetical protein